MASNKAAWLHKAGSPLEVGDAPLPTAGPDEIIIRNAAIAINPLDWHIQKLGVFVQQWPAAFGCDVAGEVYEVGSNAKGRFRVGDRVIGHTVSLITGRPQDGAFALYTTVPANKAAILPESIPFTDGVVVPMAFESAICALCVTTPGTALPGVPTPALGLPYPSLEPVSLNKTLVVYGGSSSVGSMTIQIATAIGLSVIAIASPANFDLCKRCGAVEAFDYRDADVVDKVVKAVKNTKNEFVGIFDAISTGETYPNDLAILAALGGGHLACTHPPPTEGVPGNVKAGMIFAVNDVATPVWRDFVTEALCSGRLICLPKKLVVGKGLEKIQEGLEKSEAGVSATKLVIEL
ncbi:hypothetical protein OQA88_756 [Cercophora sp. LCS_1]